MLMPERNKRIVKRSIEVFRSQNYKIYSSYLSENIKWNIVGLPVLTGKDEFIKALRSLHLENFTISNIKNIIGEGEFVVVESNGLTSKHIDNTSVSAFCDIYKLKDGKIYELTSYIVDTTLT